MLPNQTNPSTKRIIVRDSNNDYYLRFSDILYIKASGSQVSIFTAPGSIHPKEIVISKTLEQIEAELHSPLFLRTHRSWVVNLMYVCAHSKKDGHNLKMAYDEPVPIARKGMKSVLAAVEDFFSTDY